MPSSITQVIANTASQAVPNQTPPRESSPGPNQAQVAQASQVAAQQTATKVREKNPIQPQKRVESAAKNQPHKPKSGRLARTEDADQQPEPQPAAGRGKLDVEA